MLIAKGLLLLFYVDAYCIVVCWVDRNLCRTPTSIFLVPFRVRVEKKMLLFRLIDGRIWISHQKAVHLNA
jgi:hypothetical protein